MSRARAPLPAAIALSLAALALAVPAASAHPLGNFTINNYDGLRVSPAGVIVDHVTDFAEIPTFVERRAMDTNGDASISDGEADAYRRAACSSLASTLSLTADGRRITLEPTHTGLHFAMGQGSLSMRLVCVLVGRWAGSTEPVHYDFSDPAYAERRGWREVIVEGDATTIRDSDVPAVGVSGRLSSYPNELLALPLDHWTAHFVASPGGPTLAPAVYADAAPLSAAPSQPTRVDRPIPAIPGGTSDLGRDVTSLFQAPELTPPIILLSLFVAVALGALHALSPGHGKTVMAAYLVGSRGNVRQAIGLGLTVTVSHTLGVLALGALSLSAGLVIPPDRLYPILGVVSGAIVIVIGTYLLLTRVRAMWPRAHHDLGHDHDHPAGWHEHDGIGHTHLPEQGMGKRGLFALGLSGGIVPSVSALLILLGSISIGRPAYGIVLTVGFGLGMAIVLVGVGLALVYARGLVERMTPRGMGLRLSQGLPLMTACIVLGAGVLITGQALAGLGG
jgi:ABC-type nickel/cobalt efflux system permease component RcnA